jgi:hypothetical protein
MTRRRWIALAFGLLVCGLGIAWLVSTPNPLPPLDEVERMVVTDYGPHDWVEFEVPAEHHARIWKALGARPYRDRNPAKWIVLGSLKLTLRGGRSFHVWLFNTGEAPGAFTAGPTIEQPVYYRGGDPKELIGAIAVAYEAARMRGQVWAAEQ